MVSLSHSDDSRSVIYNCDIFIIQAIGDLKKKLFLLFEQKLIEKNLNMTLDNGLKQRSNPIKLFCFNLFFLFINILHECCLGRVFKCKPGCFVKKESKCVPLKHATSIVVSSWKGSNDAAVKKVRVFSSFYLIFISFYPSVIYSKQTCIRHTLL